MLFMPCPVSHLHFMRLYWLSSGSPPLKVYNDRPGYLQLFHSCTAMFIRPPDTTDIQAFKHTLCHLLLGGGCGNLLPTSHPLHNTYNGSCAAKRALKVSPSQIQAALRLMGIEQIWLE